MLQLGSKRKTIGPVLIAVFTLLCGLAAHAAGQPHYGAMTFSDSDDGDDSMDVFTPDTAKIFLKAELVDVPSGAKLTGSWIAEKTDAAPPNYKIDSVDLTVGALVNVATFSLSKPNAGWPTGDYRVELFIDGKPVTQARFKVAK